jgi:NADPH:quinone reductase-like Zn-dependent oxidoreductase
LVIRIKAPNVQPLAEYVAIEARNLAPLPENVDDTVGASLPISGLTARRPSPRCR